MPDRDTATAETDAMLRAAGITSTPEGRAEARRTLDDLDRRMSPQAWAALREQLGLPVDAA